jgi:hypothetical protein
LRRRTCPSCGEDISTRFVAGRDLYCPACSVGLSFRLGPFRALPLFAFVIVGLSLYAFGLRDLQWMAVCYLLCHPATYVMALVTARLFPPELESTGDVRGILHPVEPVRKRPVPIDTAASGSQESAYAPFKLVDPPGSLEGWGLRVGLILFLASIGWFALGPLVYRAQPTLAFTMHGPQGFPITANVLSGAIVFTNGSGAAWTCDATLWFDGPRAQFDIGAGSTRNLAFGRFRNPDGTEVDVKGGPVTTRIRMTCREPSGLIHEGDVQSEGGWRLPA